MNKCVGCDTVTNDEIKEKPMFTDFKEWWHSDCLEDAMGEAIANEYMYDDYLRHHGDSHRENYSDGLNGEQRAWQEMKDAGWEM